MLSHRGFLHFLYFTRTDYAQHMRTAHAHRTWRSDVAASMVEACVRVFSHFQRFFIAFSSLDDGCGAC